MKPPFSKTRCKAKNQDRYGTIVQPLENEKKRAKEREKREIDEACRQIYAAIFGEEEKNNGKNQDADGQSG